LGLFQQIKGEEHRQLLPPHHDLDEQWAYDSRIEIDKSIYLEQDTIKAIVDLKFNPSKGTYHVPQRVFLFSHAGHAQVQKQNSFGNKNTP
jgi:hypothetical protein